MRPGRQPRRRSRDSRRGGRCGEGRVETSWTGPSRRASWNSRIGIRSWWVEFSTDLSDQADRQLVIEAATEDEELKKAIFTDLDGGSADSILASNTSSIPITRIAAATSRADRVVGLHFFNPVPVMGLVELVTTG